MERGGSEGYRKPKREVYKIFNFGCGKLRKKSRRKSFGGAKGKNRFDINLGVSDLGEKSADLVGGNCDLGTEMDSGEKIIGLALLGQKGRGRRVGTNCYKLKSQVCREVRVRNNEKWMSNNLKRHEESSPPKEEEEGEESV